MYNQYKELIVMDQIFISNGFLKVRDASKKLIVSVNGKSYNFDYETNIIHTIPQTDISFAMVFEDSGRRSLFLNQDYNIKDDTSFTAPYRTFYDGLMKEPFKFIFPFDGPLKVETPSNVLIEARVEDVVINELLRFTSTGSVGITFLFPPKLDFVFYNDHLDVYKKGKLARTVFYVDIVEVFVFNKNNVTINCKPIGFNIYKVNDDIISKIKQITGK
jgi:hypothetical protein